MSILDIDEPFGLPNVGELDAQAYKFAVNRKNFRESDLAQEEGLSSADAREILRNLLQCKLIRRVKDTPGLYEAVPPDRARTLLLGAPVRQINRWQEEVDAVRDGLAQLVPLYETSLLRRMSSDAVELLPDRPTTRQLITEMSARCRTEILSAQPGGARPTEVLEESAARTSELLERGIGMRTLYQYAAQFDLPTSAFVEDMVSRGAEVRTVAGALSRLIVFDGEAALIEHCDNEEQAALIHDPSVVHFLVTVFEQAWLTATPFPTEYDRGSVSMRGDEVKQEIMRLFVQGEEDKIISRRMGISTRTCQRHISDIMRRIGARNRAHAGYLICQRNMLSA